MNNININALATLISRNTNYSLYRLAASSNGNHYIITNRNGDVISVGKRKHVIETWNNAGLSDRAPMSQSV